MKYLAIIFCLGSAVIATAFSSESLARNAESREVCGGKEEIVLTEVADHGFISSPGYPNNYPNSVPPGDCGYDLVVRGTEIDSVRLGFLQLRTITGDYVQVELRDNEPAQEWFDQYTGTFDLFLPELTAANDATVFLQSDEAGGDRGYLAAYAAELPYDFLHGEIEVDNKSGPGIYETSFTEVININTETGEITTSGDVNELHAKVQPGASKTYGFISSPNHPGFYPNNENIVFNLSGPAGSKFALRVLRAKFEPNYDYVIVSENGSTLLTLTGLRSKILYSDTNEVAVNFRSDFSNSHSGFLIAYATVQT
ncbi:unnamed protein product [Notodromas monacha]|uniref:CUB domain-containing protein n=1 Tax=Notodromas monacha TaxID=399045 RepID=A0A7R9GIZ7_9CRUS|nr:unnamed protein product [Notodromas monacha]CAG0924344.1 unnamed protein product [Notodromas monacha]